MVRDVFSDGTKATKRYPLDNLTWWVSTQSKRFERNGIKKVCKPVQTDVYLVLISQVEASLKVFKSTFDAMINEHYSTVVDIERYQSVL